MVGSRYHNLNACFVSLAASRRVSQPPSQSPMALIGAPLWAMSTQLSDLLDCEVRFYLSLLANSINSLVITFR
jgi:hypothetical protein